jgi:hypothetical protein
MQIHHRVVVDVDDPALRRRVLGDLVGVVRRREAGPDIQELPHAHVERQVADRPAEKSAVRARGLAQHGISLQHKLGGFAVGGEIVLAAQPVVVNPRRVRFPHVQAWGCRLVIHRGERPYLRSPLTRPQDGILARSEADGNRLGVIRQPGICHKLPKLWQMRTTTTAHPAWAPDIDTDRHRAPLREIRLKGNILQLPCYMPS